MKQLANGGRHMTLTEAKAIADNPSAFAPEQWQQALARLYKTQHNQLTDRAQRRFERRVQNLRDYLGAVTQDA